VRWETVCRYDRLLPERGVAALLGIRRSDSGAVVDALQIALFRTHDGAVHALANVDPFTGAAVLSRGIVGDRGGVPTVASPVFKQVFDLRDGRCLDEAGVAVRRFPTRREGEFVQVGLP
jgi:nitrite reductase (NADH) small subunit